MMTHVFIFLKKDSTHFTILNRFFPFFGASEEKNKIKQLKYHFFKLICFLSFDEQQGLQLLERVLYMNLYIIYRKEIY
jgi:hypothetical protein